MDEKLEKKLTFAVAAFLATMLAILLVCMVTEASVRTGWVKKGNDTYYIHKTTSAAYKAGEPAKREYRWRGNKLYYFDEHGKMLRSSTKYIKLNRDHSIRYIYTPGTNHTERWSAREKRYQRLTKKCRWKSVGNQTNLWWACDWQL